MPPPLNQPPRLPTKPIMALFMPSFGDAAYAPKRGPKFGRAQSVSPLLIHCWTMNRMTTASTYACKSHPLVEHQVTKFFFVPGAKRRPPEINGHSKLSYKRPKTLPYKKNQIHMALKVTKPAQIINPAYEAVES